MVDKCIDEWYTEDISAGGSVRGMGLIRSMAEEGMIDQGGTFSLDARALQMRSTRADSFFCRVESDRNHILGGRETAEAKQQLRSQGRG